MKYRRFGTTEMTVSEIGFGCARLGGIFQSSSQADQIRTLQMAFDEGITFYDTADMYCQGESEILLGKAFRHRRDKVIIASKGGYCLPARRKIVSRVKPLLRPAIHRVGLRRSHLSSSIRGSLTQDFSTSYLLKAVDHSLKRLGTEYLDLYQLHSPPTAILEGGEFLVPLEKLKSQGKIRHYGVSCETTQDALICLRYPGISSLQVRLSLLDQTGLDEVVPRAQQNGIAIIARECYAGGLLARSLDTLNLEEIIPEQAEREAKRKVLLGYQRIAEGDNRSLAQTALQFVLGLDGLTVTLLGMRTNEHLRSNMHHITEAQLGQEIMLLLRNRDGVGNPA